MKSPYILDSNPSKRIDTELANQGRMAVSSPDMLPKCCTEDCNQGRTCPARQIPPKRADWLLVAERASLAIGVILLCVAAYIGATS